MTLHNVQRGHTEIISVDEHDYALRQNGEEPPGKVCQSIATLGRHLHERAEDCYDACPAPDAHDCRLPTVPTQHCDEPPKQQKRTDVPTIDSAVIEKYVKKIDSVIVPLPQDPLYVSGHAAEGATVELINPDMQGWPVIGTTTADARGEYAFRIDNPALFEYGDRVVVTAQRRGMEISRGVMQCTTPTEHVSIERHYVQRGRIVRTEDGGSYINVLDHRTDEREPYLDASCIDTQVDRPGRTRPGYSLNIEGHSGSVPPSNSHNEQKTKVAVFTSRETFTAEADALGRFDLSINAYTPGEALKVEVTDVHGRTSMYYLQTEPMHFDVPVLLGHATRPLTSRPRQCNTTIQGRDVHGEPPYLLLSRSDNHCRRPVIPEGSTLAISVRSVDGKTTGRFMLEADSAGGIDAAIGPIQPFSDIIEMAVQDPSGIRAREIKRFIALPEPVNGSFLLPLDEARSMAPDLASFLSLIEGGFDGCADLPLLTGLPAFAQLSFTAGEQNQTCRADRYGVMGGATLRLPSTGDCSVPDIATPVTVQLLGPAGRKLGPQYAWHFPEAGGHQNVERIACDPRNISVGTMAHAIGDGTLTLVDSPFDIDIASRLGPALHGWSHAVDEHTQHRDDRDRYKGQASQPFPAGWWPVDTEDPERAIGDVSFTLVERPGSGRRIVRMSHEAQLQIDANGVKMGMGPIREVTDSDLKTLTQMLKSALAMAAQGYSLGMGPQEPFYDSALTVAKTVLYVMDRAAHQLEDGQTWQASINKLINDFSRFELLDDVDRVLPIDAHERQAPVERTPSDARAFWKNMDLSEDSASRYQFGAKPGPQPIFNVWAKR